MGRGVVNLEGVTGRGPPEGQQSGHLGVLGGQAHEFQRCPVDGQEYRLAEFGKTDGQIGGAGGMGIGRNTEALFE